jgi:formylglycine-generating enzyme required for sulfatase activity
MNQADMKSRSDNRAAAPRRAASLLVAVIGALAATAALGQGTLKAVTGGLETGTRLVSLPGVPSGTLTATECASGCPILRLRFDGATRFYIGKTPVPYAKFREAASKGDLQLLVVYRYSDNVLTRLRIPAAAAQ